MLFAALLALMATTSAQRAQGANFLMPLLKGSVINALKALSQTLLAAPIVPLAQWASTVTTLAVTIQSHAVSALLLLAEAA